MDWKRYASCFVAFGFGGTLLSYAVLRLQPLLHMFDPAYRPGPVAPDLAMNTAISFATTTTWQAYAGETTMTYFSQIFGLASQNFLAGAAGLAVGIAFIRGLARQRYATAREFLGRRDARDAVGPAAARWWVPSCSCGRGSPELCPVREGRGGAAGPLRRAGHRRSGQAGPRCDGPAEDKKATLSEQLIPMGPVAALEPIKNLGTNGGGFFNVTARTRSRIRPR